MRGKHEKRADFGIACPHRLLVILCVRYGTKLQFETARLGRWISNFANMDAQITNQVLGKIDELKGLVERSCIAPTAALFPAGTWHQWPSMAPSIDGNGAGSWSMSDWCLTWTREYGYDIAHLGRFRKGEAHCWRSMKGGRTFKEKAVWWMPLPAPPAERDGRFR